MAASVFFGPGDWLVRHTNARVRLAVCCWVSIFWLTVGFVLWLWLRNSLWFVGFMSITALWMTGGTMVGTETPTEVEDAA